MPAPPALPPGWRLETLSEIDGTNAELMRRAALGEAEGLALRAEQQSAGRGRRGRAWASPKGNLYLSVLIDSEPNRAGQVSFAAALSLVEAIESLTGVSLPDMTCKWPNDVLRGCKKVAGLLLEAVPDRGQVVVGMGVNLMDVDVADAVYPIGSLADYAIDPGALADAVCVALSRWLETWRMLGFAPLRRAWLERATGIGKEITVRMPNEDFTGTFQDLSDEGALLLDQGTDGVRTVSAGDVFFGVRG